MGELFIETTLKNGKTVISDSFYTSPFKIAQPFLNGSMSEIMIMQASAGILAGDKHYMEFVIGAGSKAIITGQSYTKLFNMSGGSACQNIKITVADGAELYYMPCPVIPFRGSDFESNINIDISESSRLFIWDILSCGRAGMGEKFEFRSYRQRTEVTIGGRPVFIDNTRLVPAERDFGGIGFFEARSHIGTAYLYGFDSVSLPESNGITAAKTNALQGVLVRVLADSGEDAVNYLKSIKF